MKSKTIQPLEIQVHFVERGRLKAGSTPQSRPKGRVVVVVLRGVGRTSLKNWWRNDMDDAWPSDSTSAAFIDERHPLTARLCTFAPTSDSCEVERQWRVRRDGSCKASEVACGKVAACASS